MAAASAAPAAASSLWSGLAQAWASNPAAVLLAGSACLVGVSLSIFLLAAVPTMLVSEVGPACTGLTVPPCCPYFSKRCCKPSFAPCQALRRSAAAAEALLRALHSEVPDTAAALRLTSMDVSDAIGEVAALRWGVPGSRARMVGLLGGWNGQGDA